jgi:short subunit dehydrogenase-like uncharacterized protein
MIERDYDVVLYGASGFTGKQTVRYFAENAPAGKVRWAIAGRSREKLEAVRAEVRGAENVDVLVADSRDQAAVDAIVSRARVMLTTAGPYALYGDAIVDACARLKTHYVDITGETTWVRGLIDRHHQRAAAEGTRIIPFCGFDSVPSDLGTYLLVRHIQKELGAACKEVTAYYQMRGGLNGGTMATMFNLYETGQYRRARDPFLLNPPAIRSPREVARNQDPKRTHYDSDLGAWAAPFVMGPINTRVVRRSCALFEQWWAPYGPDFHYQEYMKFEGSFARLQAAGLALGAAAFEAALRSPARGLFKKILPEPGDGPSEKTMNEGWFQCEYLGVAEDGRKARGRIQEKGDPGNRATVKILCESALGLILNADELPGGERRGGVLTPATGLGDVLAGRLRDAGMTITMGDC